ncbi:lactonase family protein [Echinicola vietnamensis]|uniref:3-carboxymuconate cyclase n=1 Tax=Echinicola vietnamensis (strain DSM 17526 / LMG 23754 / KMM 6221) TaxID=926556 RepID=L0G536_ECHVK|nr:lactonase family protein [Echinicola vietnamensis]AGA79940.1 3-carboxymuconate cyclase [Echinicola vietnamensis DSM 17526]
MKSAFYLLMLVAMSTLFACNSSEKQATSESSTDSLASPITFWLGTYTSKPSDGFHLIQYHPETSTFDSVLMESDINNPSFVISNLKRDLVFTVQEEGGENGGSVCSFRFDRSANSLKKLSTSASQGSGPCYITLSPDEKFIFAGNYGSGDLAVLPINEDGTLGEAVQTIQHTGSSVNEGRQSSPHVHSLVFHPNGKQLFVADLGTDKVSIYNYDPDRKEPLTASSPASFTVKAGSGPRHLAFNQSGDKIYLIHEITSEVGLYDYNLDENKITHLDSYALTPQGFEGEKGAAEIKISDDGQFLYASNRGDSNEIIVFSINAQTGTLDKIQAISSGGKTPRNFALSPDGTFLFVGNQNSDSILAYERNPRSGIIKKTNAKLPIHRPVYFFMLGE